MARVAWYLRKLARIVVFYAVAMLACAAIYVMFGDSLTRTQLYVVSLVACFAILIPVAILARRALKTKPNWYGRDVK